MGLCLGPCGFPIGGAVSYERGTPAEQRLLPGFPGAVTLKAGSSPLK